MIVVKRWFLLVCALACFLGAANRHSTGALFTGLALVAAAVLAKPVNE